MKNDEKRNVDTSPLYEKMMKKKKYLYCYKSPIVFSYMIWKKMKKEILQQVLVVAGQSVGGLADGKVKKWILWALQQQFSVWLTVMWHCGWS